MPRIIPPIVFYCGLCLHPHIGIEPICPSCLDDLLRIVHKYGPQCVHLKNSPPFIADEWTRMELS